MQKARGTVVITDIGSVDPDDVLALILLTTFPKEATNVRGVIATHFYPERRAQMAKLILSEFGRGDIPVYVGEGTPSSGAYDEKIRAKFRAENRLFPKLFGFPRNVRRDEREWFPNFMRGYEETYTEKSLASMAVETVSGHDFLVAELKAHSPENRLRVVCLSPMHDLARIPADLYPHMELFAMGGGFEAQPEPLEGTRWRVPRAGYNWGICPETTQTVLEKVSSGQPLTLVTSEMVRRAGVGIPPEVYRKWLTLTDSKSPVVPVARITRAVMADWLYCNRGNRLPQHKNLCDPLTLFLALSPSASSSELPVIPVTTRVNAHVQGESYLETSPDGDLLEMTTDQKGNTMVVTAVGPQTTHEIVRRLETALFPYDRERLLTHLAGTGIGTGDQIFRIEKASQELDVPSLRARLIASFPGGPPTRIVQIVGDCRAHTPQNTRFVMESLLRQLKAETDIIEWGLTGNCHPYEESYDINHMVSEIIDTHGFRSVANVVDYHTAVALRDWKCTYSRLNRHYIVVHDKMTAIFGDDVTISDGLCDSLLLVEGGPQSFLQCVNCLDQQKKIHGILGVRGPKERTSFSACEFLKLLGSEIASGSETDSERVEELLAEYLKGRTLFDTDKGDAGTKPGLFKQAWTKFIEKRLWLRIPTLVTIEEKS